MESLVSAGQCRAIGVSNFNVKQLERVLSLGSIKPVVLQVESNAHFPNHSLIGFAQAAGVAVEAFAPLGSPYRHE